VAVVRALFLIAVPRGRDVVSLEIQQPPAPANAKCVFLPQRTTHIFYIILVYRYSTSTFLLLRVRRSL